MAVFADVQYCIYADILGGSKKAQKCADVVYGWTLLDILEVMTYARYLLLSVLYYHDMMMH